MQRTGEQYTTGSGGFEPFQVGAISYPAGREKTLPREIVGVFFELCHIRSLSAADAFQVHENHVVGPVLGARMNARWVAQPGGIAIDRQDEAITFDARWRLPGFGSDNRHCRQASVKPVQARGIAQARVHPDRQMGESRHNRFKEIAIFAAIKNGVEIRDVQGAEVKGLGQASYQW